MAKRLNSAPVGRSKFIYGKDAPPSKLYRAYKPWVVWTTKPFDYSTSKAGKPSTATHSVHGNDGATTKGNGHSSGDEPATVHQAPDSASAGAAGDNSLFRNEEQSISDGGVEGEEDTHTQPDDDLREKDSGFEVSSTGTAASGLSNRSLFQRSNRVSPIYDEEPTASAGEKTAFPEAGNGVIPGVFYSNKIPDKAYTEKAVNNRRKLLILLLLLFLMMVAALCIPLALYMMNNCHSSSCDNGGSCAKVFNGYKCFCPDGYSGRKCEVNINECTSDPCFNNSTCMDGIDGFSCLCQPGFTSSLCEVEIDECGSNPCFYDATCSDSIDEFVCTCLQGYTGVTCETDIDECESSPCVHGSCVEDARSHGYLCVCASGYTGVHCDVNIDECASNPCEGASECIDQVYGYICVCEDGLFGVTCQYRYSYIYECCSDPCQNGGDCNQMPGGFTCTCAAGFTGSLCEVNINECASTPCVNGGTCVDRVAGYVCTCMPGFEGTHCEYQTNDIVLLMDASGSMSAVSSNVRAVMTAIVNDLTIGQTTSRVALVSWNCEVYRHWDFTSPISYDSERILDGLNTISYTCPPGTIGYWSSPYAGFVEARDIFRAQNRAYSRNYIIYVSDGHESTTNAAWVRDTLGASEYGSESARIILIGTSRSDRGWPELILFNNAESDRFDFSQPNVAQLVVDIIQP